VNDQRLRVLAAIGHGVDGWPEALEQGGNERLVGALAGGSRILSGRP
jgi:hypothetical protein